jgi:phage-related tail protein
LGDPENGELREHGMASTLEQLKVDRGDLERTHEALEMLAYDAIWSREDLIVLLDHALAAAAHCERTRTARQSLSPRFRIADAHYFYFDTNVECEWTPGGFDAGEQLLTPLA